MIWFAVPFGLWVAAVSLLCYLAAKERKDRAMAHEALWRLTGLSPLWTPKPRYLREDADDRAMLNAAFLQQRGRKIKFLMSADRRDIMAIDDGPIK